MSTSAAATVAAAAGAAAGAGAEAAAAACRPFFQRSPRSKASSVGLQRHKCDIVAHMRE